MDQNLNYETYKKIYGNIGLAVPENVFEYMKDVDTRTVNYFDESWVRNARTNLKYHMKRPNGWINDGYENIASDKACISVGAGPSLKRNEDVLRDVLFYNGTNSFELQDFITIVSNHQVKPCLEKGIIPHFAIIGDSSKNLRPQLEVGKDARYTTLIAQIITHPDVIAAWPGPVRFITGKHEGILKEIEKAEGKPYDVRRCIIGGGNVLNLSFMISVGLFHTPAWICIGNDLSFPRLDSVEDRRTGFYADGDYSTNIKSKRDEAQRDFAWMGFEFPQSEIISPLNYINFKLYNTSNQMFVYKTWLEGSSLLSWEKGSNYTIYNCSEQGILGVMLKEDAQPPEKYDEKFDLNNWVMMDEIAPNKWRTYKFEKAVSEFISAKRYLEAQHSRIIYH